MKIISYLWLIVHKVQVHISIDMQKSHIDLLTFSGHKALLGMSGVGGICVNTDILIHPLKTGGTGIDSFNKKQPDSYPEFT